jgi:hypothetical protein
MYGSYKNYENYENYESVILLKTKPPLIIRITRPPQTKIVSNISWGVIYIEEACALDVFFSLCSWNCSNLT